MAINSRMTLSEFVAHRLGNGSEMALLKTMFARSFGASTFADFWRYWNPVYGYYLQFYCYRPLRRFLPRPVAVVLTFAASGFFLHDLPFGWWIRALKAESLPVPFVALWFASMGVLVLITEAFKLNLAARPFAVRAAVNTLPILSALLGALLLHAPSGIIRMRGRQGRLSFPKCLSRVQTCGTSSFSPTYHSSIVASSKVLTITRLLRI